MDSTSRTRLPGNGQGRVALLIIDVQKGLFAKSTPVYQAGQLLANVSALVERARQQGVTVFYVQHADKRDLAEGTEGWQLRPELQPGAGDVRVQKRHSSAFEQTTLAQELEARNVSRLVVAGLVTHGCVKAACLDARRLGYEVTLAGDAHSSFSQQAAQLIAEWNGKLAAAGVEVKPTAAIDFS